MNTNVTFREKSKLLAVVLAMAFIVAGVAVVLSDSGVEAVPSDTELETSTVSYNNGAVTTYYDTLVEAVNAAPTDGTPVTITLLVNSEGTGIQVKSGQNIVIDFDGNTYKVTKTVGSTGTETNAAQLLKGSTVTMKDGTFTSDTAKRMIQNYCDLTLENMIIDGHNMQPGWYGEDPADYTTIATNCGDVVIKGTTTIIDKDPTGDEAGRTSESISVNHWDNASYGDEGTSLTIAEEFNGSISKISVTYEDSNANGTGTAEVFINENVGLDVLDVQYGTVSVADGKNLTAESVTVSEEGTVSGEIEATVSYENKGTVLDGTKATVASEEALKNAIANDAITEITINGEIQITAVVTVDRAVTIIGSEGAKLVAVPNDAPYNGEYSSGTDKYVLNIIAGATIQNLTVDSVNAAFGINIWSGESKITNVASENSAGAAFTIGGGATVTMDGTSASGYAWGGVNADKSATVTFADAEAFEDVGSIYGEDSTRVTVNLPGNYKAAIEMTGKWGTGKTDFKGYYSNFEDILPYYNDENKRFNYEGSAITVNKNVELDFDLVIQAGTTVTIKDGAVLTISEGTTFTTSGNIIGDVVNNGRFIATGTLTQFPTMKNGTLFTYNGYEYIVDHYEYTDGVTTTYFQFGLATNNVIYDGSPILDTEVNVIPLGLPDGNYKVSFANNDNMWSINNGEEVYYGSLRDADGNFELDADLYSSVVRFTSNITVTIEDEEVVSGNTLTRYLDLTVGQGQSIIDINTPEGNDITVSNDVDDHIFIVTGSVSYNNGYTLTIPGVYTDKTYYILVDTQYVPVPVELISDMFSGITYDAENGTISIDFGETIPESIDFTVDFDTVEGKDNWTTETYTLDLSGLKLDRDAQIDIWDDGADQTLVVGESGGSLTYVNIGDTSDLYFEDGDYALSVITTPYAGTDNRYQFDTAFSGGLRYISDTDRYYLPIQIAGLLDGATVQIGDGTQAITVEGGVYNFIYRITDDSTAIWIYIDQDGSGSMYDPVKYRVDFTAIKLQSAVEITNGDESDYYGKAPADLGTIKSAVNDGFNVAFEGTLNYIVSYPGYGNGYVGWFLPFDVNSVIYGTDISTATGTIGDKTATNIGKSVIRINTTEKTFVVDLDGDGSRYIPTNYTLDFNGVECTAIAGYDEKAENAWKEIQALGFTGVLQNDVEQQTMYIVFNPMGKTSGTYTLDFNGQPLTISEGEDGWAVEGSPYAVIVYFTFYEGNDHWNGNTIETGNYTVTILDSEGTELGSDDVAVGGLLSAGYDQDASEVLDAMNRYDIFEGKTPDVIDRTFYLIWNNESALVGDYTGYLYYEDGSDCIYSEGPVSVWNSAGVHSWYFSFDDQLAEKNVPFREGTYYLVITSSDRENAILDVPVEVIDKDTFHVTINEYNSSFDDGDQKYDIEFDAKTGMLYSLPEGNYPGKIVDHWDLYIDGEFLRSYEPLGQIHFGYVFGADEMGQNYEFRAHYTTEESEEPVVIDPTVTIDMPGSAVADGEWVYYSVTTTKGTFNGDVMGYANAIDGATVEYFENTTGTWEPLTTGDDGRYFFGNPETGFPMANATSYFRVAFDTPGSYYFIIQMEDMNGNVVCSNSAAIEVAEEQTGGDEPVDQRTQYEVSAVLESNILTVSVSSPQTASNYVNLHNAAFYYQITVQIGDDVYYLNNVIASRIIEGEYGYTDSQSVDLAKAIPGVTDFSGAVITVQFSYDYGLTTYGADTVTIEDAIGTEIGYSDDADSAHQAISDALEGSGITIPADQVADETVYSVFEADAGDYTLTMETSDGNVVYAEAASFANDGTHIWYFSLAEGQPSWSSDYALFPLVEGAVQDGVTYDLRINGTLIGKITL